jgi:O-antigen/teichoic acid export membrane protein
MRAVSVKTNIIANYVGQAWTALIGLAFVPVYIRYMGIEAYGLIGVFALLQTWLSLLDLGLTPALSREMARFSGGALSAQSVRDLLRSVEAVGLGMALLVALGIWAASDWLASDWLRADQLPLAEVARAFALMGVITALRFVENIYRSSMIGLQHQVMLNVVTSVAATLRAVGAVAVLIWISPTITAFFLWQGVISLATVAAFAIVVYARLPSAQRPGRFSVPALREVWRFAAGTLILTVLGFVLSQTDKIVLSKLLSLKEFAYYSLAFTVASSVRLLAQPVDQGIYPRLTELLAGADQSKAARTYHQGAQYSAVLMGSVAAFLAMFGDEVLALWTQDPELAAHAHPIMALLVIGMMLNGLLNGPFYLQMAAGWTGLLIRINTVLVVVYSPVVYLLSVKFAAQGAAAAWLVLNVIYLAVVVPLVHRRLLPEEMWKWFLNDISMPLLAAFAALFAIKAVMPTGLHAALLIAFLAATLVVAVSAAALAASYVRTEIFSRIGRVVAWQA